MKTFNVMVLLEIRADDDSDHSIKEAIKEKMEELIEEANEEGELIVDFNFEELYD
jgi:hypothetical protein